jgi:hypothetical protein
MSIIINNNSNINNNNSEIISYEKIKQKFNNFFNNIFNIEISSTNKKNSLEFNNNNNNNNNQTLKNSSNENKENISNNNNKINSNENKNFLFFNNNNFINKKLFYWLKSIELECYFNLFNNNNIEIEKLKKNNFNFNKILLEKIGIKKIGHIFRILIKIELELKIISPKIKNFLFEKKEILLKNGKEIYYLNELNENIFCFNLFNKEIKRKKKFIFDYWLKKNKIFHLKKNFIENGFDFFEYFIIQMFSNFPIDEKILKNEMKIKNSFEREIILFQLNKDVKYIKRNIENKFK